MVKGKLIIFSAPSGAGKTTVVKHLLSKNLNLEFSVSATSRQPRPGETNGKDYYFLSESQFRSKIKKGEFLEWEEVYKGILYGTLKSEVERIRDNGKNVVFDVDVVGGLNIKRYYGSDALAIFIKPPSIEVLRQRLEKRSTESAEKIQMRVSKAEKELAFAKEFDVTIVNDDLPVALQKAEQTLSTFLSHTVGLYFGSFNPIHTGHMAIANHMITYAGLDQVWFIISPHNPHKERETLLHHQHRLKMAELAISCNPALAVSDIEFSLPQPNYTINTLTCLLTKHPDLSFRMLIGSDNLENFHRWKSYREIITLVPVLVYPRPGFDPSKVVLPNHIEIVENAPMMNISSSFVREAISRGKDVRHLLPPGVWEYIQAKQLYT